MLAPKRRPDHLRNRRRPSLVRAALLGLALLIAGDASAWPSRDRHDPTPPPIDPGDSRSVLSVLPEPGPSLRKKRDALEELGVRLTGKYIGEIFANTSGGLRQGAAYDGRFRLSLDADFGKLANIPGLALHASGLQLHGRGIDALYVGALMPPSNIEASRATRLYELWLQQSLFDDRINIRAGQLGSDQEFMYPIWGAVFVNGAFGWPVVDASNLPGGGPAYPLSNVGARVTLNPNAHFSFLAAVLDGDPAGPQTPFDNADPQRRNPDGLRFRMRDPRYVIGEAQLKYGLNGLDGVLKLGGWRHFGQFADQRWGTDFLSLSDPNSNGVSLQRHGDQGYYAILDQQIGAGAGPGRGAGFFLRAGLTPNDRNLVSASADAGVSFVGVIDARPDDLFGVAVGYARISNGARGLDRDTAFFNNPLAPIRSSEELVEATYIARMASGWYLQPDLQYIRRPGGNAPDPRDPTGVATLHNSLVLGLRTLVRF
ncbi:carbohydrate porin [Methylocystis sp. MJC1]|jgi:porin|uniref:carbohydrate porin n=1 Tax=Methylocystis sp. MJC1 TaxID=2654282 RepID=UPI0013EC0183|nr:carbohydrate porin [Methylocystis sp. MJC1]KAF2990544.1 Porin B [Methylocystis sp. MJC1]MBU6525795.1 carbohydrate porin [Methylocystis sp. MJC1]UZX12262.1 carbohydrate porin [Methylocystis sp. MJC1]